MFAKQRRRRTPLKSTRPRTSVPRSFPYNHTPLRWDLLGVALSFLWGLVARIPLPRPLRVLLFKLWAYCYKCRLDELAEPLEQHRSLSEFFSRRIRADVRPVCPFGICSPVDGRVVSCGEIGDEQMLEQVKGKSYTTAHFFGPEYAKITDHRVNPDSSMFYLIAYLSPGDYHRFHSPVDWSITSRKAFPGTLFPVSPFANRMIPSLLALNERVALFGKWAQGFFSFTAVGAYNVGSIRLNHEISLKTNDLAKNLSCPNLRLLSFEGVGTYAYEKIYDSPVQCERAMEIGHFNFGSTVVIVFEANRTFQFSVNVGDTIKLGEPLGL